MDVLHNEDFTSYFIGNIGSADAQIDILTMVHHAISFDEGEKNKQVFEIKDGVIMNFVPYDLARLEEIRNKK